MKILDNLFDGKELIETDDFYWNLRGTVEEMPNFWYKHSNIQVEWHGDDPARSAWTNMEAITAEDAISLLSTVREEYDIWLDGK